MAEPTRVIRLTPPGTGAIATIALEGPRAWVLAREAFVPASGSLPDHPPAGSFWFGKLGDDTSADEVVLTLRAAEPRPAVEIHCHGGPRVVEWLTRLFLNQRCVEGTPWRGSSADAMLPADTDTAKAIRAEALELLSRAPTTRSAAVLLDQAAGAFAGAVGRVEAGDAAALRRLALFADLGGHLVEPWRVVLAGPPNVGKSSLLNAIQGQQRAVVSETPGTTRDAVSVRAAIDGWPVDLTDTAGLRAAADALEGAGIERSRGAVAEADLCVWLLDASSEAVLPEPGSVAEDRLLLVWNKTDVRQLPADAEPAGVRVSAKTGVGVAELLREIGRRLVPVEPGPGEAVPPGRRWAEWVRAKARG